MAGALFHLVAGIVLLALGGDSLVKAASTLARRAGASPFAAGLVLVAFATSVPELAVNLCAMAAGEPALALGNAVGSNIANFGLTLGAAALCAPLRLRWPALPPLLLCLVLATVAAILLAQDGRLSRIDGAILVAAFAVVLGVAWSIGRRQARLGEEFADLFPVHGSTVPNLARLAIAAALLWFGASWVVRGAVGLGPVLGMEALVLGLLPVAIGTALPEVAAAIAAARRGQGDLVAGHVIGSSLVNLLLVVGGMALVRDVQVPASFVRFELPAALVLAALLLPMLRGGLEVSRAEGAVLLAAFLAWVGFEVVML
ncbi:sodium:calcium antiporter [Luteimonas wenzhouensis]|uniref:Sodium:calcium antiporter n=1 Tax=Luteimonas wenzhouensis TaxID=2599615 RepID=A0A5C5TTB5_9GAMM|nr:sodium:calcium antiporter [Luteimonas wenzhouensis]TWT16897.1 sodium:calcium antiporter [Luteimonas wenzhouensis]